MLILFKLFLLGAIAGIGYLFFFRVRSRLVQRVSVVLVAVGLAVFVLAPDLSTRVALFFGIGRGTDFILYLAQVFLCFLILIQYLKIQSLQDQMTRLTRSLALLQARPPTNKD